MPVSNLELYSLLSNLLYSNSFLYSFQWLDLILNLHCSTWITDIGDILYMPSPNWSPLSARRSCSWVATNTHQKMHPAARNWKAAPDHHKNVSVNSQGSVCFFAWSSLHSCLDSETRNPHLRWHTVQTIWWSSWQQHWPEYGMWEGFWPISAPWPTDGSCWPWACSYNTSVGEEWW